MHFTVFLILLAGSNRVEKLKGLELHGEYYVFVCAEHAIGWEFLWGWQGGRFGFWLKLGLDCMMDLNGHKNKINFEPHCS